MNASTKTKELHFIRRSREERMKFPESVRRNAGYALHRAQEGKTSLSSKPLKGFGGAVVREVKEDFDGDAYRVVYTVKFAKAIYVLHCFQKKSKKRNIDIETNYGANKKEAKNCKN